MGDNEERKQIIEYIKEHYDKFRKTPSMKDIQLGCKINPRVFYNLFKNQKEAFNLAHVPYSDLTRKKVEKANIARKRETGDVLRRRPL